MKSFHRKAPFLFFNGNTFADIARKLAMTLVSDLPVLRRREVASAIGHYVAGVLDRDAMVAIVDSLCHTSALTPGDRVKTFRGTLSGTVVRNLPDGRVVWKPDTTDSELLALPESLVLIPPERP